MVQGKNVILQEPKRVRLYDTFLWSGYTRYACSLCAFDCGSEEQILAHIDDVHLPQPVPASGILVADKRGNVVTPEPEDERVFVKTVAVQLTEEDLKKLIE